MAKYYPYMRDFINSRIGQEITRNQLIVLDVNLGFNTSNNTIDRYKSELIKLGVLKRAKHGTYTVLKKAPAKLYKELKCVK
jgi:hypothetical protein|nr:MAG: hypothetical protein [Bacteriophage sp.]UWI25508.1 MAG: hypothetical protein [Bacteriophage sp.]